MSIIENNKLGIFLLHSYELMKKFKYGKRYYHTLTNKDNSPLVIRESTDQITYVVEGSGKVYLSKIAHDIKKGKIILIESGTTIRFVASSEGLTLFHIHIPDTGREDDRRILEGDDFDRYVIE